MIAGYTGRDNSTKICFLRKCYTTLDATAADQSPHLPSHDREWVGLGSKHKATLLRDQPPARGEVANYQTARLDRTGLGAVQGPCKVLSHASDLLGYGHDTLTVRSL